MTDKNPINIIIGTGASARVVPVYQCRKQWSELQVTDDENSRYCDSCKQNVHEIVDLDGYQRAVKYGQCVSIEGRVEGNLDPDRFFGSVSIEYNPKSLLDWEN